MSARPKFAEQLSRQRSMADHIPFSNHVSPTTLVTRDGDLMRIWKVTGISFETVDAEDIALRKEQTNTLLRAISSNNVAIWTHTVRRQTTDRLEGHFDNDFCREFDKKYYDSFEGYRMMANELYLTLIYRPAPGRLEKAARRATRRTQAELEHDLRAGIEHLDELALQVEANMRRYGLEALSTYVDESTGALCSTALQFLNYLLSGVWQKVRVPKAPLYEYLGNAWVFVGAETIELRSPTRTRFAQGLDFKDYTAHTEPGLLNGLMYESFEFVMTQSFSFMAKHKGKTFLERQQRQLQNTEDGSATQIKEISDALDQLLQGQFAMGEYHFSLLIFGDSVEQVKKYRASAMAVIQDQGFIAALVNTATDAAFYAQLPGNWSYRPRVAGLTSLNMAGLASFHNFYSGKRNGNPWGDALTLFKTPSGQPLYFNFHFAKGDEDQYDKKVLGNTRIIGQSGAGKTVLMGALLAQSQKYKATSPNGYTDVFFDKDRGAELLIRAMGGKYLAIMNGQPTGLNPFQIEATEENILFLERLVKVLVSGTPENPQTVSTADEERITHAVRTVMRMPKELRRLSLIPQNITEGGSEADRSNSLVKRLKKWCVGGPQAWVLDNPVDMIDFSTHSTYGFDGTDFLDNADVRTPISMYLLHRMESVIDGRRFVYYMDEAWKWVDDEAFADFAGNKQLTIRKQNGLGVFATQMPSSLLKSKVASELVQQVATEIYLPNPKANFKEYTEGFLVTKAEFQIISSLVEESRMFLVKQGHLSVLGHLDLTGFDDELLIFSGSLDNSELLAEIIAELGTDDPAAWRPVFLQRVRARKAANDAKKQGRSS